jgi:flagella basal body P-ring formation protein FlgA
VAVLAVGVAVLIVAQPAPAGESRDPVSVLIAVRPIAAGTTAREALDSGRVALKVFPTVDVRRDAIGNIQVINDEVARRTIRPGEQLTTAQFGLDRSAAP